MKRPEHINQHLLVIGKYHGATNTLGSRISFRTGIPNSKRKVKSFDHRFNNIQDQVAYHLKHLGVKPICQVQMPDNSEVGLLYPWKPEIINKIGLK